MLSTRGNDPTATTSGDPGALKVFRFADGQLSNEKSVANGNGMGFGPRHADFHATKPWMYVSMERNNEVFTYGVQGGGITSSLMFAKPTVSHPEYRTPVQYAGPIHIHPNGKMLVTAAVEPLAERDGDQVRNVPAGLSVFSVGDDGRLAFARKYDVDVGNDSLFWCGMVAL